MKRGISIFFGFFAAVALVSCGSPHKVKMVGVEGLTMVDQTKFEVTVRIANGNGNNLAIKRASLALVENGTQLIELSLAEKVVIPRRSEQGLVFPVTMRFSDPDVLSALPGKAGGGSGLTVAGRVTGQSGIFSKTYRIGPMPMAEFLAMLDEENRTMIEGFVY